jgi:hypothetical protein
MHVIYQLKTSNDLELFELELPSKSKLEDVCNLRQPLVFNYYENDIQQCTLPRLSEYNAFDITMYDSNFIATQQRLESALQSKENYFSANNADFLHETMVKRHYSTTDAFLRPPMVSSIQYDLLFGANNATTRLEYSTHYRNYFYVTNGSVSIKLTPPRNTKYLNAIKDYGAQENYSTVNPWLNQVDKVKFLEITLTQGKMIFIPAYWWYSIKFEKDACVCGFKYKTIMNVVANLPDICIGILQRQNTKIKIVTSDPAPVSLLPEFHTSTVPDVPL